MPAEDRYEAGWRECWQCGCRRPAKVIDAKDGRCSDDWHEVQVRQSVEFMRRVSAGGENAEGTR